jgi:hypothetical protein
MTLAISRHAIPAVVSRRTVDMPEGTYLLRPLPNGHWEVRSPNSDTWHNGFTSRYEASLAIAERTGPFAPNPA